MLTTPHAVTGAAIGALVPNPLLAIPLALTSHYLTDAVPHWQETLAPYIPTKRTWIRVPIDLALSITLVGLAAHWQQQHFASIWLGAFVANIPDLDVLILILPKLKKGLIHKYWAWHCKIQRETSSLLGLFPQFAVITLGLSIAYIVR